MKKLTLLLSLLLTTIVASASVITTAPVANTPYIIKCIATDHDGAYLADDGITLQGRATNGTPFFLVPTDTEGRYYIKSNVTGKYINAESNGENAAITFDTTPKTYWTLDQTNANTALHSWAIRPNGTDQRSLNNNGSATATCPYMKIVKHTGSGQGCALWTFEEIVLSGADVVTLNSPVTSLTSGAKYYIYDAHADNGTNAEQVGTGNCRYAFRYDDGSEILGTHSKPANSLVSLSNAHVWEAIKDGNNWKFKNVATGKYIGNGSAPVAEGSAQAVELESTNTTGTFTVKVPNTTNNRWDGEIPSTTYKFVYWGGSGHPYRFYEAVLDEDGENYHIAFTANADVKIMSEIFKSDASDANPYVKREICILNADAPEYKGFTPNISTVNTQTSEIIYTLNNGNEFRLYNERAGKYMTVAGTGDSQNLSQDTDDANVNTIFKMVPVGSDNGFVIYSPSNHKFIGAVSSGTDVTMVSITKKPQIFYTGRQSEGDYMSWMGTNANKNDNVFFNDKGSAGASVCGWSWNDDGSKWVIVTNLSKFKENWALRQQLLAAIPNYTAALATIGEEDTDNLAEWAQNYKFGGDVNVDVTPENMVKINKILNATTHADIIVTKRNANKLIALGGIKQSAITAWNNAVTAAGDNITADALSTLTTAYATLGKGFENIHINIQSGKTGNETLAPAFLNDYIGAYLTNGSWEPRRYSGGDGTRAWTLEPVSETEANGFYLFNEYTNKYFKHPIETNHNGFLVDNKSEASVYMLDVYVAEDSNNENKTKFGIKTLDDNPVGGYSYLHSNGDNHIVPWNPCHPSSWYISQVSDEIAATEHLNGAVALAGTFDLAKVGTGIGYYSATNTEDYTSAKTVATAAQAEGTSATERNTAANALWAAYRTMNPTLITPTPGRYYRIKNVAASTAQNNTNEYMSNVVNSDNRLPMVPLTAANHIKTIWVFDGSRLIAYPSGKVIGKFTSGQTNQSVNWGVCNEGSDLDNCGTVTFTPGSVLGSIIINVDTNRQIHGAGELVNSGQDGANDGYSWYFDAVEWLPIRESDGNPYKTFVSTEELKSAEGRYHVYDVEIEDGKVVYNEVHGNIPAGKPVLLIETAGAQKDGANHHVYLQINEGVATATTVTDNGALHGSFKAGVKNESKKYFALNENFAYAEIAGGETEGFTAYIEPGEDAAEELAIKLSEHEKKSDASIALSDNSHKIVITHSSTLRSNPAVAEPLRISVDVEPGESETEEQQVTSYRAIVAYSDDDITITNEAFTYANNTASVDLQTKLNPENYTLSVPTGFFLADGKATPAHSYSFTVKSDGTTVGINEVMMGLQQGDVYDLQGRRLAAPARGINIIGGRKVLVK